MRFCEKFYGRTGRGILTAFVLTLTSVSLTSKQAAAQLPPDAQAVVDEMKTRGNKLGDIHLAVAAHFLAQGKHKSVLHHIRLARRNGVQDSRTSLLVAGAYRKSGRFDAAFTTLVRILVRHPGQPVALIELWKTLFQQQLQGTAVQTDIQAIRSRLSSAGLYFPAEIKTATTAGESRKIAAAGFNALLSDNLTFAIELFKSALDLDPSYGRAHRGLGIAWGRQHSFKRAAGAYTLYLDLNPRAADGEKVDRALMRYWKKR
jgi:Tfp pilus assembly protein PilF